MEPPELSSYGRQHEHEIYLYSKEGVMAKTQINVRLDEDVARRLDALALKTGRTKTFYATEAILDFLEEREDYFLAKDSLRAFQDSGDQALGIDDLDWPTP